MKNIVLFASGTGSNARKIVAYFEGHSQVKVVLIISNKKDAPVLDMAKEYGVDTLIINRPYFYDSEEIIGVLQNYHADLLVLAGFLWLVPTYLVKAFPHKILNIHPALLPKYGGKGMHGMHVHEAVWAAKENESGITIHEVNEQYDEGEAVFQARVALETSDQPKDIARKVLELEHHYFPEVIERFLLSR